MKEPNIVPCPECTPNGRRTFLSELGCSLCGGKRKIDLNTTSLSDLPVPICPSCGARNDEWWDACCFNDSEGVVTLTCERCDTDYSVSYTTSISFTSEPLDEDNTDPK